LTHPSLAERVSRCIFLQRVCSRPHACITVFVQAGFDSMLHIPLSASSSVTVVHVHLLHSFTPIETCATACNCLRLDRTMVCAAAIVTDLGHLRLVCTAAVPAITGVFVIKPYPYAIPHSLHHWGFGQVPAASSFATSCPRARQGIKHLLQGKVPAEIWVAEGHASLRGCQQG